MRVAQINATCGIGSTGKICADISRLLTQRGNENVVLYSSGTTDLATGVKYLTKIEEKATALLSRLGGAWGFYSRRATRRLLRQLDSFQPDVVHLHNLHAHNVNLRMLLSYLAEKEIPTVWTFHDCWAFTGYCMHYAGVGCEKWQTGCHHCSQKRQYSWLLDKSARLYQEKRRLTDALNLTVVTPSRWMADQVALSFLKDKAVRVIHNGIDRSVFTAMTQTEYPGLNKDNPVVLGVSYQWNDAKGLDAFMTMASQLPDTYQIVLVGTDDAVDRQLPRRIRSIHRTTDQKELARLYAMADVLVNPTREDTFPTVNMEALACGTPVVTYATGGSGEIPDETSGIVVPRGDIAGLVDAVRRVCEENPFTAEDCMRRAAAFDKNDRYEDYLRLYEEVMQ